MAAAIAHNTPFNAHASADLQLPVSPGKATLEFEEGAPCNFFYLHLHDAIRAELLVLEAAVKELLREEQPDGLNEGLAALQERYIFLVQIFKYHSSVEDEVRRVLETRALLLVLSQSVFLLRETSLLQQELS